MASPVDKHKTRWITPVDLYFRAMTKLASM